MILVDTNLLVYAHVEDALRHVQARDWLDDRLSGAARVGLPWQSLLGFLRVVSNPRVAAQPRPIADAWRQVDAWLGSPAAWIPEATDRHREVLGMLLMDAAVVGNLVPDAHLAALAIEHGLTLCSADGDFARFRGLRWENPLA